jgi:hypothetical protein
VRRPASKLSNASKQGTIESTLCCSSPVPLTRSKPVAYLSLLVAVPCAGTPDISFHTWQGSAATQPTQQQQQQEPGAENKSGVTRSLSLQGKASSMAADASFDGWGTAKSGRSPAQQSVLQDVAGNQASAAAAAAASGDGNDAAAAKSTPAQSAGGASERAVGSFGGWVGQAQAGSVSKAAGGKPMHNKSTCHATAVAGKVVRSAFCLSSRPRIVYSEAHHGVLCSGMLQHSRAHVASCPLLAAGRGPSPSNIAQHATERCKQCIACLACRLSADSVPCLLCMCASYGRVTTW